MDVFCPLRRRVTRALDPPLYVRPRKEATMSLLYIILIIVLVLALLGFVGRGRF